MKIHFLGLMRKVIIDPKFHMKRLKRGLRCRGARGQFDPSIFEKETIATMDFEQSATF